MKKHELTETFMHILGKGGGCEVVVTLPWSSCTNSR